MNKTIQTLLAVAISLSGQTAIAQTVPDKPTMGWSSWNTFALNISEDIIKGQATAMRTQKLFKVGYDHINIDDGYFGGRDPETGKLLIHPTRFPNGLKPVVDYIHTLGLKAGIYSDGGKNTCGNYWGGDKIAEGVGLYGHDQQDCDFFFKELGFDFIKVDFCGGVSYHNSEKLNLDAETRYKEIAKAIENTGRTDVRMNVCRWDYPGNWVHDIAASWRTTGDINASWESIKGILAQNLYLSAYCYGGHYNDMDMLEVGKGGLSDEENRTHFGMWCIMSSPLLIGCDLKNIKPFALLLLKNTDLIALNQDDLCIQAYVVQHVGDTYVLVKDLEQLYGKTRAVALYNPSNKAADMSIKFTDLDLDGTVKVRDCYEQQDLGEMTGQLAVTVPAHGTRIYRLEAETRLERNLYEAENAYLGKYQEIFNNQEYKSAVYESNDACSGKEYVGWLGNDPKNDLQWRNVYSDKGGDYQMTLSYMSGDNRDLTISVNGKDIKTFTCNSGNYSAVGTKTLTVTLEPGENLIRLYNKSALAAMPNIDCMTLQPVGTTDRVTVGINAPVAIPAAHQNDGKYYTLDGKLVRHPHKNRLYIHNGKKVLVR
ncbi:MAG: alpha-galactosidase [Bacteroidaceae bacterium]|nr:alpha-galactosidase [Bacteroidaceae bacterium]